MVVNNKLSVLTFSKETNEAVINLAKNVYGIADEVVIIDSSSRKRHHELKKDADKAGLSNVRIVYAPPLGYVEPYRMYGLSECKNDWVLYLDSDELINDELRRRIPNAIEDRDRYAFLINRENFSKGKRLRSDFEKAFGKDYQVRLYRKSKIRYSGTIHEGPLIGGYTGTSPNKNGKVGMLPEECKIMHNHERDNVKTYLKLEAFLGRKSYKDITSFAPVFARPLLVAYYRSEGKSDEEELSRFDYVMKEKGALLLANMRPGYLFMPLLSYADAKISLFFDLDREIGGLLFRIYMDVRKDGGVIKYLGLGSRQRMEDLSEAYAKYGVSGVDFFITLLIKEFFRRNKNEKYLPPSKVIGRLNKAVDREIETYY